MKAELGVVDHEEVHRPVETGFSSRVAVPYIDLELREKLAALVGPVVLDGLRTDDEHGIGDLAFFAQPGDPRQSLQGFSEAHVVGQHTAEIVCCEVGEKVEAFELVGTKCGSDRCGRRGSDAGLDFLHSAPRREVFFLVRPES